MRNISLTVFFSNISLTIFKFLNKIIVLYVKRMHESKGLGKEQMALVIKNFFTRKMALEVKEVLQENNILVTNVPANMAKFYQPLDLTIKGSATRLIMKKFNG